MKVGYLTDSGGHRAINEDSRGYLIRGGKIEPITDVHTFVFEWLSTLIHKFGDASFLACVSRTGAAWGVWHPNTSSKL